MASGTRQSGSTGEPNVGEGAGEVLAAVHGSDADTPVVQWASDEAVRLGTELRLVHVIDPGMQFTPYPALMAGAPNLADDLEREAEEILARAGDVARARHPDLDIRTSVPWGPPGGSLRDLSTDARRLVIGGSRSAHLERMILGSVAVPVIAHARCPVVVVPDGTDAVVPSRIVVGVDGSKGSLVAVEAAFETAAASGCAVTGVIGWSAELSSGVVVYEPYAQDVAKVEADGLAVAHEVVDPVAARYPQVPVDVIVRHGSPADVVVDAAAEVGADLVVVGSRGHGGFVGLLLGSVSRRVVDRAGRVVMVAH